MYFAEYEEVHSRNDLVGIFDLCMSGVLAFSGIDPVHGEIDEHQH